MISLPPSISVGPLFLFSVIEKSIHLRLLFVLSSSLSPTLRFSPTHTQPHTNKHTNKQTCIHTRTVHAHHVQQANGQASNTVRFSYAPPRILQLLCVTCTTAGGNLTLTGTNFGSSAVAGTNASVRVGGSDCAVLTPFDHTSVRCALPAGQGTLSVTITITGQVLLSVINAGGVEWVELKERDTACLSSFSALVTDLVCIFRQVTPRISPTVLPSSQTGVEHRELRRVTFAVCLSSLSHLSSLSVALCFTSEGYLSVCPSCVSVSSDLSSSPWTCTSLFTL